MTEIIWLQRMYSVSMATCNYACCLESRYSLTESVSIPPLLRAVAAAAAEGSGHDERVNKPRREEI